jgi:hypothetical protein
VGEEMTKELLPCACGAIPRNESCFYRNVGNATFAWCSDEKCGNSKNPLPTKDWNDVARHTHELRQENARLQREHDEALIYLSRLATSLVKQHYPENAEWTPLNTVFGVISQIDNATTRWNDDVVRLEIENAKFREALRFYADEKHVAVSYALAGQEILLAERGVIARKALGEEGK